MLGFNGQRPWARTGVASAWLALGVPVQAAEPVRDLIVHDVPQRAACHAAGWREASTGLERAAAGRDVASLQALVRALLCGEGADDAARVLRAAPARIPQRVEGTGEAPRRRQVDAAEVLVPRAGAAWALQVQAAGQDLRLSWQANEACVQGLQLRHRVGTGWRVVGVTEACD